VAFYFVRPKRCVTALVATAAVAGTLVLTPTLASAAPHAKPAKPNATSVQRQLGTLATQNSQLVEKYNQARIEVTKANAAATAAHTAAQRAQAASGSARAQFVQMIQAQYEGQSLGATSALLDSSSGTQYLDRLTAQNMVSAHDAGLVASVTHMRDAARAADSAAAEALTSATARRDALGKKRDAVEAQIKKYRTLLSTLTSAQRADYQRASDPNATNNSLTGALLETKNASPAAQKAVKFALAQVGKPYVFGAAGPGSYDCSGLTMAAWHTAGVNLPHSAADQYNHGHHVARNALAPGDLIFFYHPIGHVTIYIGDGYMVSAPTEGENVSVVPLSAFNSDYVGATRVG
jgi:cell wall-associated NlpC family hydrolase